MLLLLTPMLAACGVYNPMISGRGTGHTGGTLDKMEAIPGYRPDRPSAELQDVVAKVGCDFLLGAEAHPLLQRGHAPDLDDEEWVDALAFASRTLGRAIKAPFETEE